MNTMYAVCLSWKPDNEPRQKQFPTLVFTDPVQAKKWADKENSMAYRYKCGVKATYKVYQVKCGDNLVDCFNGGECNGIG